jgi:hypothetical protein
LDHGNNKQTGLYNSKDIFLKFHPQISITMTGLLNLPFGTLEQICELIAGSRPSNLIPFSEVSKECLAASSQSLWRTIRLRTYTEGTLGKVDKLKHIIQTRLSRNARVRCISVSCREPSDDRIERRNFSRHITINSDDGAWHSLANLLAMMPPLSEMEWESRWLPSCILQSLNSQHHGCRLRIVGVKYGVDKPLDIDEQPAAKLSFMYELLLPLQNDRENLERSEAVSRDGNGDLAIIGSLSASLTQLKHRNAHSHYSCVRRTDPSGFELVSRNSIGPHPRYKAAALSSLELLSQHPLELEEKIGRSDIIMWSILTHLPALNTLKSKLVFCSRALKWLTSNASDGILGSLKTLGVVLDSRDMSRRPNALVSFLRSLPPLEHLALAGEIHSTRCKEWISFHASSLERLQLTTTNYRNSTFNLVSLSATMQSPLLLLEHLSITIKRSKGNSDEVSMYKILGAMPRLQSIVLGLDTSTSSQHTEFWAQRGRPDSERDADLGNLYVLDALVNKAVDDKSAIAIFRMISAAKHDRSLPLERLEVRPDCGSGEALDYLFIDWDTLIECIERSWLVMRRYPGLGSDELSVSQIQCQAKPRKQRPPIKFDAYTEIILRKIWPPRAETKANWRKDWQKEWHSFPLEQAN